MDEIRRILMLSLATVSLTACALADRGAVVPGTPGQSENTDSDDNGQEEPTNPTPGGDGRYLVLYTSRSGNTERLAYEIRDQLDCDILKVEPATAFEEDYNAMLERAREELDAIRQGNYPAVGTYVEDFDKYELVLVGYPVWHGSMATTMQSFLYRHASKLGGKRMALFATSGGSGISLSASEAAALCPDAEFVDPALLLTSSILSQAEERVASWLDQLGIHNENNDNMESNTLKLTVNGRSFTATLEDNSSVAALKERLTQGDISIRMNDYGDMEKVGSLGFTLPRNDVQTTTSPGDLILYQGSSFVIYYYTNSWSFTRLGKVDGVTSREQMLDLLGGIGEITVTLSLE